MIFPSLEYKKNLEIIEVILKNPNSTHLTIADISFSAP